MSATMSGKVDVLFKFFQLFLFFANIKMYIIVRFVFDNRTYRSFIISNYIIIIFLYQHIFDIYRY
jgi:hypothetical protein